MKIGMNKRVECDRLWSIFLRVNFNTLTLLKKRYFIYIVSRIDANIDKKIPRW